MISAIVHHGPVNESIDYYATVTGPSLDRKFFFEQNDDVHNPVIRYFGGGSELSLRRDRIEFRGNGGLFSEYMFGSQFPVQDLLNAEAINRLVLFGANYDRQNRELSFTSHFEGIETYENLFFNGNAVANYFFFIDDRRRSPNISVRQEATLKAVGRLLKRSRKVGDGRFMDLAHEMIESLGELDTTLFMVRLVHKAHQILYDACRNAYAPNRSLAEISRVTQSTPELLGIDSYQRERIQIDVIYHHPDNQELIDEYKRVLAACSGSQIGPSERARLMRLRTLSLRNDVPLAIFDTLEDILLEETKLADSQEPEYIQSTREVLEGFLLGKGINPRLMPADMVQLVENKQKAVLNRDGTFEQVLLETGRLIDERSRGEEEFERLESFSELVTFFDRFDHTTTTINKLAFMDDAELSPEQIRSVIGNMHVFESLRRGLFQSLFIDPILSNGYTLAYGRKKLFALTIGLVSIDDNEASLNDVSQQIRDINRQERAYFALYGLARRRMANFYLELNTPEGRDTFRREIAEEMARDVELRDLKELINDKLLDEVITKIRLEAFYINQLLPRIAENEDAQLRNDFLINSGLDRFQIEELEQEYFALRAFPQKLLDSIQQKAG